MLLLSQVMGESRVKWPLWKALVPAPHTLHSVRPEMRESANRLFPFMPTSRTSDRAFLVQNAQLRFHDEH